MSVMRKRLNIGGMSCINCQNKMEHKLKNTAGIEDAKVSYQTGVLDLVYDSDAITLEEIQTSIEKMGYAVLPEGDHTGTDMGRMLSLLVIILSLYVLFQQLGILNLLVPGQLADAKMGYGMLFVIGLLTSVHCIAMCGGINLSQCMSQEENRKKKESRFAVFRSSFLYNLGRVISYTVIGFILGFVGMVMGGTSGAGVSVLFQGILKMLAGIFMVIMGMNMLEIFPWLRRFQLHMPKFFAAIIYKKKAKNRRALRVGMLNGLMPCGPLQAMQIVALASGNPLAGAFSMFLFSLGTVPLMLGLGSLVSVLSKKFAKGMMAVGAVLVVVLGLAMLSQGGSLSGLLLPNQLFSLLLLFGIIGVIASIPFRRNWYRVVSLFVVIAILISGGIFMKQRQVSIGWKKANATDTNTDMVDGEQIIRSTLDSGSYPTITVQSGTPVKWIIDAPKGSINGCNYKMLLKEYGITHTFSEGENVITFTPTKSGTISYTCWMGMIRGYIIVQ